MRKPRPVPKRPRPKIDERDRNAYQRLLDSGYTKMRLGQLVGISKQAVTRWQAVPLKYVTPLSNATGIRKRDLRPSDFA
jgi:hypothetical protein